jgi:outer membrane receptor protein involved in Fe transport
MKQRFTSISILTLLISLTFSAQAQYHLSGKINTAEGPLVFATILLNQASDSSLVKAEISNEQGNFSFAGISSGSYFLEISYVGLEDYQSEILEVQGRDLSMDPIEMQQASEQLDEVTVSAIRPLIEVNADMTVLNVENTINAIGSDGFELLRKAPGVIIDNNNNIILDGKGGVQIHINGKPSVLSGEDLVNFLRSLQSTDIEAIEVITQPSAKYDAEGTGGIINIRLRKDKGLGTNGSVSAGFNYGQNARYNASATFNNRTKKTNFYGSLSNNFGESWNFIYLDRIQQGVQYDSETETLSDYLSNSARLGLDYFPAEKHTIGFLVDGSLFERDNFGFTSTPIIPIATGELDQTLIADNESVSDNFNANANVNYRFADTLGHELTIDLDYGQFRRDRTTFQPNSYLDSDGSILTENNFRMIMPTDIWIAAAKADYSQNLAGGKLGFGVKFSYVNTDNTFDFFDVFGEEDVFNADRSNQFVYTENINAAYVNYSKRIKKWSIQAGVRMEQTNSEGDLTSTQVSNNDNVKRNYVDFFPSAGLSYTVNQTNSLALNYSRRIERPDYQSLNPFESQIDELSFSKGNPFLQPQYINNVKISHTYKYRFTTSLSYAHIQDFFAQVTDTLGATRNFLSPQNIANQQVWSLGFSLPFEVQKWWSVYLSVNAFHASYEGSDERFVPIDQSTLSFYAQNTFSLPMDFKFEVSGWFSSPSIWGGTYLTKSLGSLDLAVQKKFLDDRLTGRVAVSDILYTAPWRADMTFGDLYINGRGGWESRQFKISLSYAFGSQEIKSSRNRKTGLEEEGGRVGE